MIDPAEVQKLNKYPEGLCHYFLNGCGWKGTPENIAKFGNAMSSLEPSLREEAILTLSSRWGEFLETSDHITSLGGFFLELGPEKWVNLIIGQHNNKPRENWGLACFFAKHSKDKLLGILPDIQGKGGLDQGVLYGDIVATKLYQSGLLEAEPAAISSIRNIPSEFKRFLVWMDLCKVDFERHNEDARLAAYQSLDGSPEVNNHHVPALWLAENFPDEALPKLCELIRSAENDSRPYENWAMVAYEVLSSLGTKAESLLQACADTTRCDLVRAGAKGAIRGGFEPPNPTISKMLRRLLKVDDSRSRASVIETIGSWGPDEFIEELERFATSTADAEVMQAARWVLALHEGRKLDLSGPEADQFLLTRMAAETPLEPHLSLFQKALKPCLHIRTRKSQSRPKANESQLGGSPLLPDVIAWPRSRGGTPLTFIARISANDIRLLHPAFNQSLLFFADWEQQDGCVIPIEVDTKYAASIAPDDLMSHQQLNECALTFSENLCLPQHSDDDALDQLGIGQLRRKHDDSIRELLYLFEGRSPGERTAVHRLLGYPRFTQSSPIPTEGGDEWMSLLSLETDDVAGLHFYDTGTMTFAIRREDWDARDFSKVTFWADYM